MELPVERRGHQSTHKIFNLKFILPTKCAETKMEVRLREQPNNDGPQLETHPLRENQPLALSYACAHTVEGIILDSRKLSSILCIDAMTHSWER